MISHRVKKGPPLSFPEILIFASRRLTDKHEIVIIIQAPITKSSCTNTLNVISVTKSKKIQLAVQVSSEGYRASRPMCVTSCVTNLSLIGSKEPCGPRPMRKAVKFDRPLDKPFTPSYTFCAPSNLCYIINNLRAPSIFYNNKYINIINKQHNF